MTESVERSALHALGYRAIRELESDLGILASGRGEAYGCIFGRDSLITGLQLLRAFERARDPYLSGLVRKILLNLCRLQGTEENIESGEEPGKCIHEYRPTGHEHLTRDHGWYLYDDGIMRNYDTVDATPLFLIAIAEYLRLHPEDRDLKDRTELHVRLALNWIAEYGDKDRDGLIDYHFHPKRQHGGLRTQSWMDSTESLFHDDGAAVPYPIAPVEVQAYAYHALRAWADLYAALDRDYSMRLTVRANLLKERFNARFVIGTDEGIRIAYALDGSGKPMTAARSSIGHALWAAHHNGGSLDAVLDEKYVSFVVERLMRPDLFVPDAGFRTLSSDSPRFDPQSYHNGTIWPHDTALVEWGLRQWGYTEEANRARAALLLAFAHFQTPIELFAYTDHVLEYETSAGSRACRTQAWSAASLLALTS